MEKLLINLLVASFVFAFIAPRHIEKITFATAGRCAGFSAALIALTVLFSLAFKQPLATTFFVLDKSNDLHMGVIYSVVGIYASILCVIWSVSRNFHQDSRRDENDSRKKKS